MKSNRGHISTDNWSTEGIRWAKLGIVCQSLPDDRHHAAARLSAGDSGELGYCFRRREQRNQEWTNHGGEGVVGRLVLLSDGERVPAQFSDDCLRYSYGGCVSFERKRDMDEFRQTPRHEGHQRMHGGRVCSSFIKNPEYLAGQHAAGVECDLSTPVVTGKPSG